MGIMLKAKPVQSTLSIATLFSIFAAISAFVGLTAVKEGFKICLNISKKA